MKSFIVLFFYFRKQRTRSTSNLRLPKEQATQHLRWQSAVQLRSTGWWPELQSAAANAESTNAAIAIVRSKIPKWWSKKKTRKPTISAATAAAAAAAAAAAT